MVSFSLLAILTMTLNLVIGPLALASFGIEISTLMLVSVTGGGSVGLLVDGGGIISGTFVGAGK